MKKAALPTNPSLQPRVSSVRSFGGNVLPSLKGRRSTIAVSPPASAPSKPDAARRGRFKARCDEPVNVSNKNADAAQVAKAAATSLAAAVSCNDIDTVKALIKADVDLRPVNWYDTPVLVTAAEQGSVEIVQLLLSASANVNNGYERLPLTSAAGHGHLKIVRLLLAAGAYLEAQDAEGHTALMAAAAAGHLAVVHFLVEKGARLTQTGSGETALSLAAKNGHQLVYGFLHQKMMPVVAEVLPESTPPVEPTTLSVMDELISNAAAELNDLLSNVEQEDD